MVDELPPTLPYSDGDSAPAGSIGRFVSIGVLGRGGMGVVIRARDPELDREVAIKVLTSRPGDSAEAGRRLQREAQAMAKLSHPNVVTVYETGLVGDERFIAMELVEGETLRQWLITKRPWREVVAAFVACGRGLAAAHSAGIVHRDFKPENVLIGADGRPRVTDFGLVGIEMAIAGTPGYMAPEQWLGEDTDARTDVFAFCVSLWEALYGAKPFTDVESELRAKVLVGKITPPGDHEVAAWVEPVLRRGLARDRAERWPAMEPLLAALDRKVSRRWPWLAGGVVSAGALAAGFAIASPGSAELCPDPEPQLASIWDGSMAANITAAFRTASPAIADDTAKRVTAALDAYAKQWREASIAACRATNVDGTQSPDLLDRRIQCLDRRKAELAALTSALAKADRARVATAIEAAAGLGAIDQCANVEQLLALAPPTDPALRAKVDELRFDIDALYEWRFAAKPLVRQTQAAKLVERARALHHAPILLRALDEANDAATDAGDSAARETYLRETALLSAEAHDDGRAARAWIDLIRLLAEQRRLDEAKTLEPVAAAAVVRAGSPARLRYVQLATVGIRKMYAEDYPGAVKNLEDSVAVAETDAERAAVQLMLAQVVHMKEGPGAATPIAEASLAFTERAYGPSHPQTAKAKHFIAQFMAERRDLEGAAKIESEVIASLEAALGPDHREVAMAVHLLGNIEKQRGRLKEARKLYERAIVILDGTLDAGLSRGNLATVVADLDGLAAARPLFERALRDLAPHGKDQAYYLSTEVDYAYRLLDAGACAEATPLLAHAIEELPSKRLRQLPQVLEAAAHCDVLAKQPAVALAKLERAHKLCAEVECHPESATMVAFKLGRLLFDTNTDRARGLSLVEAAHAAATAIGDTEQLADIDHWRKLRGLP